MTPRPIRRAALLAAAVMSSAAAYVGLTPGVASANDPVIVFYTICEKTPAASTATDTVKVKRVNEDGTSAVTIGDTGIAACQTGDLVTTNFSGFAVAGEYGYFSWFDATTAGVGRIRLDGTGTAEKNFITAPAGTKWIQMSPTSVGGYLYAYLDKGTVASAISESRIARVPTTGGSFTTVISPVATDALADRLSFGVGKTALYFATGATGSKLLEKVNFDGTGRTSFFNFADFVNDNTNQLQFLVGSGANLIADSGSKLFLYDQNGTSFATGISTINSLSPDGTRQGFVAVPSAVGPPPAQAIVWGGNFLYFKDGDGLKIGRTKADGTGRSMDIFPTLMTGGYVHHISPALASTVTVTTTTTTSSTTTSSSTTSSTTTTVAAATSTTAAATTTSVATATSVATTTTTARAVTTTTVAAPTLPKKGGLPAARLASVAKVTVPKGARVGVSIAPASRKICAVRDGKLVSLKLGDCRVTVTVTPKQGKSTRASVTLKSS